MEETETEDWKFAQMKFIEARRRFGIYSQPQQGEDHHEEGLMNQSFQSEGNFPLSQDAAGGDD